MVENNLQMDIRMSPVESFIKARSPFRISFFGGGTDYPDWYHRHGGAVLSTSINKYCYIICRYLPPFFPLRHRISWSHIETVNSISEILHPAIREGLRMLEFTDHMGIELHHFADLPARAGMGSSSAFANTLILALKALRGEVIVIDKRELFRLSLALEQDRLKENVGSQDQVATAMGGLNRIYFQPDGSIEVVPLTVDADRLNRLQDNLLLFFTGTNRLASEIAGKLIANFDSRQAELHAMRKLVDEAAALLEGDGDLDQFGVMLHETWERKRRLAASISNPHIDDIYRRAREAGALGGKLLGAGAAGFMVFYAPPERHAAIQATLGPPLLHVPFRFESDGSALL